MSHSSHLDGYVQFKLADAAREVLLKPVHKISNYDVNVQAARPDQQPDYKIPSKSLVPDVVKNNFGNPLYSIGLASDAILCELIKDIKKNTFSIHLKNADYLNPPRDATNQLKDCNSLFNAFHLNRLSSTNLVTFINQCNIKIRALKLTRFKFPGDLGIVHPLLPYLDKIELIDCSFKDDMEDMFSTCTKLKILRLENCDIKKPNCLLHFPQLEEAYFLQNVSIDDRELDHFFILNPTIKKCSIRYNLMKANTLKTCNTVITNMLHYEDCEIYEEQCPILLFNYTTPKVGRPIQLKKLSINFYNTSDPDILFQRFVTYQPPLEDVTLEGFEMTDVCARIISQIKTIKVLVLNAYRLNDRKLLELGQGLTQLQELQLRHDPGECDITTLGLQNLLLYAQKLKSLKLVRFDKVIDDIDIECMAERIKNRDEKIKLVIEVDQLGQAIEVSEGMKRHHQQWISIIQNGKIL